MLYSRYIKGMHAELISASHHYLGHYNFTNLKLF